MLLPLLIRLLQLSYYSFLSLGSVLAESSRKGDDTNTSNNSGANSTRVDNTGSSDNSESKARRRRQPIITINLPQSEIGNDFAEKAKTAGREGWAQTKIAGM